MARNWQDEKIEKVRSSELDTFVNSVNSSRARELCALREKRASPELDKDWSAALLFKHLMLTDEDAQNTKYELPKWERGFLHLLKHRTHAELIRCEDDTILSSVFAVTPEFHWPWPEGDIYLQEQFQSTLEHGKTITNILAATASGKTGLSFRALSSNYGLYLTCTSSEERERFGKFCDLQMASLHSQISSSSQEDLHLHGLSLCRLAMIARLCVLVHRTTNFMQPTDTDCSSNEQKVMEPPSPKEFLSWQVNGMTKTMKSAYEALAGSPLRWESPKVLLTKINELHDELAALLGVTRLPLFIDEANVFALPLLKDRIVITANGRLRPDGLLSLLLQSVIEEAPWDKAPILLTGTGFTTEVSIIVQSAGISKGEKTNSRPIWELVGHPLVHTPKDALEYLEKVIAVPKELKQCIESLSFRSYFPMRRRLLVAFLRDWWFEYSQRAKSAPSENTLLGVAKKTYKKAIEEQVIEIEKRLGKCQREPMLRALGIARFLCINQSEVDEDVSLFGKGTFLRLLIKESPQLFNEFIATGFCSYHLRSNGKDGCSRKLTETPHSQADIFFNLREPLAQDTLNSFFEGIDRKNHNESLECLAKDICSVYPHSPAGEKIASNHFELLSCFAIQSLFKKQPNPRSWSFIQRQAEPLHQLPNKGFFSEATLGKFKGIVVGERSLMSLLEKEALQQDLICVENILERVRELDEAVKQRKRLPKSDDVIDRFILDLPKTDRIIAVVLQMNLHHLIDGFLIFPSEHLRPDAIGILKVSDKETDPFRKYGLILSATKRQTSSYEETFQDSLRNNEFQVDRTRVYQKRVNDWMEFTEVIANNNQETALSKLQVMREEKMKEKKEKDSMWQRSFDRARNSKLSESAWMKCTTQDGKEILMVKEEYACSVFSQSTKIQSGIAMRKLLDGFEHCLPIAIDLNPSFPQSVPRSSGETREGQAHKHPSAYHLRLDDLIEILPGAEKIITIYQQERTEGLNSCLHLLS